MNWHLSVTFRYLSLVPPAERSVNVIQIVQYLLGLPLLQHQTGLALSQDRVALDAKQLLMLARIRSTLLIFLSTAMILDAYHSTAK